MCEQLKQNSLRHLLSNSNIHKHKLTSRSWVNRLLHRKHRSLLIDQSRSLQKSEVKQHPLHELIDFPDILKVVDVYHIWAFMEVKFSFLLSLELFDVLLELSLEQRFNFHFDSARLFCSKHILCRSATSLKIVVVHLAHDKDLLRSPWFHLSL